MRLYGGRIIHSQVRREISIRQELRDAIVYDIDSTNKYCRVKIQGSDKYIKAYYNENWGSSPEWLKPGNAVRITHPGGNKGRIEVVGHGLLLPTAIPGGNVTPPAATLPDAVLSGMALMAPSDGSMTAWVYSGTYRIDGIEYSFSGMTMDNADIEMDRPDLFIDEVGGSVAFDAAHATLFRYDKVVVGADGILDVVKGTNASGEPSMPDTPVDHVMVGWVLICPGMTSVTAADVYREYSSPVLTGFTVTYEDQELSWGDDETYFTVVPYDQYGQVCPGNHTVRLSVQFGTGTFSDGAGQSTCSEDGYVDLVFNYSTSFRCYYERELVFDDPEEREWSPTFLIMDSYTSQYAYGGIRLLDSEGAPLGEIYV